MNIAGLAMVSGGPPDVTRGDIVDFEVAAWIVDAVSFEVVTKDEALVRMLSRHTD